MIKRILPWVMTALCAVLILLIFAIALSGYVWADERAPGSIPPEPEPPGWDKSSLAVNGACVDGKAEYVIANNGSGDMDGPAYYWLLNVGGGASTCFTDLAAGYIYSGTVELAAGESVTLQYDMAGTGYVPPFRLCIEQRKGHPGVGWASATAEPAAACAPPTALEPGSEPEVAPLRRLYLPHLGR